MIAESNFDYWEFIADYLPDFPYRDDVMEVQDIDDYLDGALDREEFCEKIADIESIGDMFEIQARSAYIQATLFVEAYENYKFITEHDSKMQTS